MSLFSEWVTLILHPHQFLLPLTAANDNLVYFILFAIIFAETGLIITPFLPGDALLFAAGAIAAVGVLEIEILTAVFLSAAISGDAVNYSTGRVLSKRVLEKRRIRFVNERHLEQTQRFYKEWGAPLIVVGRFAPILRTFAPFVAGVAAMNRRQFALFNVAGAMLWVGIALGAGYAWGDEPFVKGNFGLVMVAVVIITSLPPFVTWCFTRRRPRAAESAD
jgi:membrane-associated protein